MGIVLGNGPVTRRHSPAIDEALSDLASARRPRRGSGHAALQRDRRLAPEPLPGRPAPHRARPSASTVRLGTRWARPTRSNNLGDLQHDAGDSDQALSSYQHALDMYRDWRPAGRGHRHQQHRQRLPAERDGHETRWPATAPRLRSTGASATSGARRTPSITWEPPTSSAASTRSPRAVPQGPVLAHQIAERFLQAESLSGSGSVHLAAAQPLVAAEDYRTAIELSQQIGNRSQEAQALTGLGDACSTPRGCRRRRPAGSTRSRYSRTSGSRRRRMPSAPGCARPARVR